MKILYSVIVVFYAIAHKLRMLDYAILLNATAWE